MSCRGWPCEIYSDARHAWEQGWTQVLRVQALADLMILALFFTSLGYRLAFYTAATSAEYATSRPQAGTQGWSPWAPGWCHGRALRCAGGSGGLSAGRAPPKRGA